MLLRNPPRVTAAQAYAPRSGLQELCREVQREPLQRGAADLAVQGVGVVAVYAATGALAGRARSAGGAVELQRDDAGRNRDDAVAHHHQDGGEGFAEGRLGSDV